MIDFPYYYLCPVSLVTFFRRLGCEPVARKKREDAFHEEERTDGRIQDP